MAFSSAERTDTGTIAISGSSGSADLRSRYARSAPELAAMTTSFSVVPKTLFTSFASASGTEQNAQRRCGVIERLNGVLGARVCGISGAST